MHCIDLSIAIPGKSGYLSLYISSFVHVRTKKNLGIDQYIHALHFPLPVFTHLFIMKNTKDHPLSSCYEMLNSAHIMLVE